MPPAAILGSAAARAGGARRPLAALRPQISSERPVAGHEVRVRHCGHHQLRRPDRHRLLPGGPAGKAAESPAPRAASPGLPFPASPQGRNRAPARWELSRPPVPPVTGGGCLREREAGWGGSVSGCGGARGCGEMKWRRRRRGERGWGERQRSPGQCNWEQGPALRGPRTLPPHSPTHPALLPSAAGAGEPRLPEAGAAGRAGRAEAGGAQQPGRGGGSLPLQGLAGRGPAEGGPGHQPRR